MGSGVSTINTSSIVGSLDSSDGIYETKEKEKKQEQESDTYNFYTLFTTSSPLYQRKVYNFLEWLLTENIEGYKNKNQNSNSNIVEKIRQLEFQLQKVSIYIYIYIRRHR